MAGFLISRALSKAEIQRLFDENIDSSSDLDGAFDIESNFAYSVVGDDSQHTINYNFTSKFNLFFTDEIMNHIASETNRRAPQIGQASFSKRRNRMNNWTDTTKDEVRVLMALFLLPRHCSEARSFHILE